MEFVDDSIRGSPCSRREGAGIAVRDDAQAVLACLLQEPVGTQPGQLTVGPLVFGNDGLRFGERRLEALLAYGLDSVHSPGEVDRRRPGAPDTLDLPEKFFLAPLL